MAESNPAIIVGGVFGGIVIIAAIAGGIYAFSGNSGIPLPSETTTPMVAGKRRKTRKHPRK
jgi:hypothetical protein